MSSTTFALEHTTGSVLDSLTDERQFSAVERDRSSKSDIFVREAMQSARSLWALSTVTRLMMAREQCLRATQQNKGQRQRIRELEASLENIAGSKLPPKTKHLVRERILEQIERLQQLVNE